MDIFEPIRCAVKARGVQMPLHFKHKNKNFSSNSRFPDCPRMSSHPLSQVFRVRSSGKEHVWHKSLDFDTSAHRERFLTRFLELSYFWTKDPPGIEELFLIVWIAIVSFEREYSRSNDLRRRNICCPPGLIRSFVHSFRIIVSLSLGLSVSPSLFSHHDFCYVADAVMVQSLDARDDAGLVLFSKRRDIWFSQCSRDWCVWLSFVVIVVENDKHFVDDKASSE
jgi:hypothetical protein